MPESVTDRPTKSHEYIFMFAKAKWTGPEVGPFDHISDEDARWLALFLDTEGNIAVKRVERNGRKWYGAQVAIAGSHLPLLEAARAIIGRGTILERPGTNAPMYSLQLSNQQAAGLLRRVYPYLIVKCRQARIAMHLQTLLKYRGGRAADRFRTDAEVAVLESLWLRNKECNQFGTPDLSDVPEPRYGKWTSARYYYDQAAIAEPYDSAPTVQNRTAINPKGIGSLSPHAGPIARGGSHATPEHYRHGNRNKRSVWTVATQSYDGAHFATFPPKLIEPCILAGTSEAGQCPACGAPWVRVVERTPMVIRNGPKAGGYGSRTTDGLSGTMVAAAETRTTGWAASCTCDAGKPVPQTVLDPFGGSGTAGAVAERFGRNAILIELNPAYRELIEQRTAQRGMLLPLEIALGGSV